MTTRSQSSRAHALLSGVIAAGLCQAVLAGLPEVPGFEVSEYATTPVEIGAIDKLTIDPATGAIYLGQNDPTGSIVRVPPGGGAAMTWGTAIPDPDAVLFDVDGAVSGVPGAVIVGGLISDTTAQLWAVLPDEQVVSVCGPTSAIINPTCMTFDADGTMLIADINSGSVVDGAPCPGFLVQIAAPPSSIDLDGAGNIHTTGNDGVIRIHTRAGALINARFATGLGGDSPLQFGPGGATWGDALYVIDRAVSGELRRYALDGSHEVIGTGFNNGRDLEFGPDGAMYVAMFHERRVLRIVPSGSCLADIDGSGTVDVTDLLAVLSAWGPCPTPCPEDIDRSGAVDVTDLLAVLAAWGPCD